MPDLAVIGCSGTIGKKIHAWYPQADGYNRTNIDLLYGQHYSTIFCAAPSGQRRHANANPDSDAQSVDRLISCLATVSADKFCLIGTIDSVAFVDTPYGANRFRLEQAVLKHFRDCTIVRLAGLIDGSITKNILFDLKHRQFLDKINPQSMSQWTPLEEIRFYLETLPPGTFTLVSEPISVKDIVIEFFPELLDLIGVDPVPVCEYDLVPYMFDRRRIFDAMKGYFK
jgi:hypothetical protein